MQPTQESPGLLLTLVSQHGQHVTDPQDGGSYHPWQGTRHEAKVARQEQWTRPSETSYQALQRVPLSNLPELGFELGTYSLNPNFLACKTGAIPLPL